MREEEKCGRGGAAASSPVIANTDKLEVELSVLAPSWNRSVHYWKEPPELKEKISPFPIAHGGN